MVVIVLPWRQSFHFYSLWTCLMGEKEDMEEGEVEEEKAVTVGEEVLTEEVVTSKGHKALLHQALDSRQMQLKVGLCLLFVCQIHHLSLHTPLPGPHPLP